MLVFIQTSSSAILYRPVSGEVDGGLYHGPRENVA